MKHNDKRQYSDFQQRADEKIHYDSDSGKAAAKEIVASEFCSSRSFCCRSACSLSQALIPSIISTMVPVVPKNTRGAKDFRFIPTGIAIKAPATEKTQVPRALHIQHYQSIDICEF